MNPKSFTRREVLRGGLAVGAAAALPGVLAACGGAREQASAGDAGASSSDGAPSRGGHVRIAVLGSPSDTLDPRSSTGSADFVTLFHIYDSLALLKGGSVELSLAESIEPNADVTAWTIRLRAGVTFHDGRPVRAADVAYSLRTLGDSETSPNLAPIYADIDFAALTAVDDRTLQVPLLRPRADFLEATLVYFSLVVPEDTTDFTAGIGSGPFRVESYEPGGNARLVRYEDYWGAAPVLDAVETIVVADPQARLNAVKSGEAEYALGITPTSAATETANDAVTVTRGGAANSNALVFAMNVTLAPFDDPDVRRALKLAIDRQALVDGVLLGEGVVGNDLLGLGLPDYADDIPQRERDVDHARRLLQGAGVDELTLRAADLTPGIVAAAELFAEQLREVGVTCRIDEAAPDTYFDDFHAVLTTPFQGTYYINRPVAAVLAQYTGSTASINLTGYATPEYDAIIADAQATTDAAERSQKFHEAQRMLWDEDGTIVWGYQEQLAATVPGLTGVELTQSIPLFGRASLSG